MHPIAYTLYLLLDIYSWIIIFYVILSLLINFNILDRYSPYVYRLGNGLFKICKPALNLVAKWLPSNKVGMDLAPLILLIILSVAKYSVAYYG